MGGCSEHEIESILIDLADQIAAIDPRLPCFWEETFEKLTDLEEALLRLGERVVRHEELHVLYRGLHGCLPVEEPENTASAEAAQAAASTRSADKAERPGAASTEATPATASANALVPSAEEPLEQFRSSVFQLEQIRQFKHQQVLAVQTPKTVTAVAPCASQPPAISSTGRQRRQ